MKVELLNMETKFDRYGREVYFITFIMENALSFGITNNVIRRQVRKTRSYASPVSEAKLIEKYPEAIKIVDDIFLIKELMFLNEDNKVLELLTYEEARATLSEEINV